MVCSAFLFQPAAGILKHAQPRTVGRHIARSETHLNVAKDPFWMRHHG
ncbi:MAG: hypothetical protein RI896_968, partial [Pseudomonadota bacterium]